MQAQVGVHKVEDASGVNSHAEGPSTEARVPGLALAHLIVDLGDAGGVSGSKVPPPNSSTRRSSVDPVLVDGQRGGPDNLALKHAGRPGEQVVRLQGAGEGVGQFESKEGKKVE